MTNNELLEKLDSRVINEESDTSNYLALRAVVELHSPQQITLPDGEWGIGCRACDNWEYPCETIQAIEKELQ